MSRAPLSVEQAARHATDGGVLLYPTEGVWGLGCLPEREDSIRALLGLKQRPADKGIILIAAELAQLQGWIAPLDATQRAFCQQHWPGAVTLVVPAGARCHDLLSGGRDTLAVRVSAHPTVQALCRELGSPLLSTSANLSGQPPCRTLEQVDSRIRSGVDAIVMGECGDLAGPTPIFDLRSGTQLR